MHLNRYCYQIIISSFIGDQIQHGCHNLGPILIQNYDCYPESYGMSQTTLISNYANNIQHF